jgi:tetratricopeptide (TPR) repeat protein
MKPSVTAEELSKHYGIPLPSAYRDFIESGECSKWNGSKFEYLSTEATLRFDDPRALRWLFSEGRKAGVFEKKPRYLPLAKVHSSAPDEEYDLQFLAIDASSKACAVVLFDIGDGEVLTHAVARSLRVFLEQLPPTDAVDPAKTAQEQIDKARGLLEKKKHAEARACADRAVQLFEALSPARRAHESQLMREGYALRGQLRLERGELAEAIADLSKAAEAPGRKDFLPLLAEAYLRKKDWTKAVEAGELAAEKTWPPYPAWIRLGEAYLRVGRIDDAKEQYALLRANCYRVHEDVVNATRDSLEQIGSPAAKEILGWFEEPAARSVPKATHSANQKWWSGLARHGSGWQSSLRDSIHIKGKPNDGQLLEMRRLYLLWAKGTFTSFEPLKALEQLRVLRLESEGALPVKTLGELDGLRLLTLSSPEALDLGALATMNGLRSLTLRRLPLTELAEGMLQVETLLLSQMPALAQLDALQSWAGLKRLELRDCEGVSKAALKRFLSKRPDVAVSSES